MEISVIGRAGLLDFETSQDSCKRVCSSETVLTRTLSLVTKRVFALSMVRDCLGGLINIAYSSTLGHSWGLGPAYVYNG